MILTTRVVNLTSYVGTMSVVKINLIFFQFRKTSFKDFSKSKQFRIAYNVFLKFLKIVVRFLSNSNQLRNKLALHN